MESKIVTIIHKKTKLELFFERNILNYCFIEIGRRFFHTEADKTLKQLEEEGVDTSMMEVQCAG